MADIVYHIISSTGKYNFVQEARCKHCAFFAHKKIKGRDDRLSYCYSHRKNVFSTNHACNLFKCNDKYVIYKSHVQLNLFDYA